MCIHVYVYVRICAYMGANNRLFTLILSVK